jgi:ATP-binding cassette subfamily B protein
LIGINGAGKSTLIKLLLRFYEPQSGQILLDGKDIKKYSIEELHKLFGVCFQNTENYSLTMRENIAISDVSRIDDTDAVNAAAHAAGADKIYENFTDGLESDMTRKFNDKGYELSGGQWQKIGIARAFFRNSRFIILDEPSSALDPEAEDFIFSSFKSLCQNKGGILISHRLSSIIMVDEVVLLDNGTVIEQGTHAELIRNGGKYTELYNMQAEKYINKSEVGANA